MLIDITTTATIRPEILDITLESFCKNLFNSSKNEYKLIINIDPIGADLKRKNVIKVAKKYFSNIIFNVPDLPGFTKAVIWCWKNTTADYIFHLEDDWRLVRPISLDYMINILNSNPNLVSLRLNKNKTKPDKNGRKFGFSYYPKISLNPTLFKGEFIRTVTPLMDQNLNPEKQLRINKTMRGSYISLWKHGIYTKESFDKIVHDIGRDWMTKTKFFKKTGFMNWEIKT